MAKRKTGKKDARRLTLGRLLLGGAVLGVLVLAALAWRWQASALVERIVVSGHVRADSAEIVRFAAVPDSARLYDLEPALLADRVRRAPWVRTADVRRRPTGTLTIRVEERTPTALVVGADGRPSHFLDAEGFGLPLRPNDPFDVPLLRGSVPAYHPTAPVEREALRDLLAALASADADTDALVSEITIHPNGEALLRTTPDGMHGSLAVRLAAGSTAEQLRRLRAFWEQAILTRPETTFRAVDLRFDGQVVTDETTLTD